jgi:photosystem II stability/assembly factor-like uncharacterized protein
MPRFIGPFRAALYAATLLSLVALTSAASRQLGAQPAPVVTTQPTGVNALLQAMHAVNDSVVWAAGNNGVVLRTLDGGTTWTRLSAPAGDSLQYRDVHAFSRDSAVILAIGNGSASRIYQTTDGGATWALQFINRDTTAFYDCLSFGSRKQGIVFGDASEARTNMLRTDDGGKSWTLLAESSLPRALPNEGAFAASGQCVVHGDSATVYVATGAPGARLFRSRDAGRSWTVENTPFVRGIAAGLTGLSFTSAMRGLAVGADINKLRTDNSASVVGYTADGGRTWEMRRRPPLPGAIAGVTWVPGVGENVAVVSGYGGSSWSLDGGWNWTAIGPDVTAGLTTAGRRVWLGGRGAVYRLEFP